MENCNYVDYGYFGNLEVFSQTAFATPLQNSGTCNVSPDLVQMHGTERGGA